MTKLLFIFFSVLIASTGYANVLSPQARLKRTSRLLTDLDPSWQDYMDVQKCTSARIDEDCLKRVLQEKASNYTKSPAYTRKMVIKLAELFSLRSHPAVIDNMMGSKSSAMFSLFKAVFEQNLSWDQLLISKSYSWSDQNDDVIPESVFFDAIFQTNSSTQKKDSYSYQGKSNDPRLAGVLTTNTFADRFSNSLINLNYKRAAAVFRIFLCDDMKPVVLADQSPASADRVLNLALGELPQNQAFNHANSAPTLNEQHASDPKCQSCHYKLNPVGSTFGAMGVGLSNVPSPGMLRFTGKGGREVKIPVRGIGELAQALVKQPEYAQCQVRYFWKMLMPMEAPLTEAKMNELTDAFDGVDRKTNSFIEYLITRPEFYDNEAAYPKNLPLYSTYIKPVLNRCNSCHMGLPKMPDFTKLSTDGDAALHDLWINKISEKLDLTNNGRGRMMPPKNSGWDLNPEIISKFQEWIKTGARTNDDQPNSGVK